jgi:hypothetical protein
MIVEDMTKDEQSLLLFLETCAVDFGTVDTRHMNSEDMDIAKDWTEEGFITFGRMPAHWIQEAGKRGGKCNTHYVSLTPEAFELAHKLRRERAERVSKRIAEAREEY